MSDLSPRMAVAFADLRADSQFVPDAARRSRARVAMHEARAEHASRPALAAWWETVRRPLRVAAPVVAVAGATWLLMAGWSAPAGTPLHPLRLAREEAQLALPGSDRVGLELSFAEDRLREAAAGPDPVASLQEAASLLADARVHLPSNHTTPVWRTWQADVETLSRTKQQLAPSGTTTSPASRGLDHHHHILEQPLIVAEHLVTQHLLFQSQLRLVHHERRVELGHHQRLDQHRLGFTGRIRVVRHLRATTAGRGRHDVEHVDEHIDVIRGTLTDSDRGPGRPRGGRRQSRRRRGRG